MLQLLIIDEFQILYRVNLSDDIWRLLKLHTTSSNRLAHNLFMLMFAVYGQHEVEIGEVSTVQSTTVQRTSSLVHLTTPIQLTNHFPATWLSLSKTEFRSLIDQCNQHALEAEVVPFDETVSNFLWSLTEGHLGV